MTRTSSLFRLCTILAVLLAWSAPTFAQTATGQITGTVRDASGAVVPGVKVVVTTSADGPDPRDDDQRRGDYVVPLLPVGPYVVTAEQAGFKIAVPSRTSRLTVDQVQRVDMQLDAGNMSRDRRGASRRRSRSTPRSASVGHTITERQVTDLPLNGRNFLQLLFLGAGAVETTGEQGGDAPGRRQRDQHHGRAADLEQLHARRHGQHRHGARHAGGDPVGRRDPGVQGADRRPTRRSTGFSSNQINIVSKTGTNRLQRDGLRVPPERRAGRAELLRRSDVAEAEARSEAVRLRGRRAGDGAGATTAGTRRSSWSTTRGRGSSAGPPTSTPSHAPTSSPAGSAARSSIR